MKGPATLKDFQTQELALERQTQLWELSKFEPIGTHQEEIAKKFCRFQIREDGSRLNTATKNQRVGRIYAVSMVRQLVVY